MITDVESILQRGERWPPECDKKRLKLYQQNNYLFDGDHAKVYTGLLKLFHSSAAEWQKIVLVLNWHRRLSTLWPDLLIGERPNIQVDESDQANFNQLLTDSSFWPEVYKTLIDMSRFGVGIVKGYIDNQGYPKVQAIPPSCWFPIQDESGQVIEHMLAWTLTMAEPGQKPVIYLHIEIHRVGEVETRVYQIKDGKIATDAYDAEIFETGVDDFLVVPFLNLTTTTNQWGCDDYTPLDPIIKRLETRLTRIGRVLDAHSEPSLAVPEDAITRNPQTGEPSFDTSLKVFPIGEGQKPPEYVVWEGQMEASFREVDFLMGQLYAISETCPQAFGQNVSGTAESGTSLRLRLMAPLKRVERLRINLDPAVKQLSWVISQLAGIVIDPKAIAITWLDGLPQDDFQQSQIEGMNVQNGITSKKAAAKRLYGLTDEQVDAEQAQMKDEMDMIATLSEPGPGVV